MPRIETAHQARKRNATATPSRFLEELPSRDVFWLPHHCNLATHEWTGRGHAAPLQACRIYSPGSARRVSHDAGGADGDFAGALPGRNAGRPGRRRTAALDAGRVASAAASGGLAADRAAGAG